MSSQNLKRMTLDELDPVSQNLALACARCGTRGTYDVGAILHHQEGAGELAKHQFTFTKYFRCQDCGGAGPWEVADLLKIIGLALRSQTGGKLFGGRCVLFDGTYIQTPAMGEDHLLALIDKDPGNSFLCTRLGNLLRGSGEEGRSIKWYEKSLFLDPGEVEARYHLYVYAMREINFQPAILHASLLARHLLRGRHAPKEELTKEIASTLVQSLREAPPYIRAALQDHLRNAADSPERTFIRTLLKQKGHEEQIQEKAMAQLLKECCPVR